MRISWEMVEAYVSEVALRYANVNGVYGIPRGGLVLAVMISHKLNIPLLMSPAKGCLIVDDICDSGESLLHYSKNSSGIEKYDYKITTMFYKKNNLVKPDYYFETKKNEWVVFPWEE